MAKPSLYSDLEPRKDRSRFSQQLNMRVGGVYQFGAACFHQVGAQVEPSRLIYKALICSTRSCRLNLHYMALDVAIVRRPSTRSHTEG